MSVQVNRTAVEKSLDEALQKLGAKKDIPHVTSKVVSGDGSFVWEGAAGRADEAGRSMRPDTPFWIASVTKLFIAAAVLKLHEQGRLSIDAPVAEYLPPELIEGLHRKEDGTDNTQHITLRHLLAHATGLPDYIEAHRKDERSLFDTILEEGDTSWSIAEGLQVVKDIQSPLFDPQALHNGRKKKVRYSDTNYQLLIAVIEEVSGTSLEQVFDELIYTPLGMQHTYHPGSQHTAPGQEPAALWYKDRVLHIPAALASFRDLISTVDDLLIFMKALMTGTIFDTRAPLDLMQGEWNRFGFSISPVGPGWPIEYGLGLMRVNLPRALTPFHPIPEIIGHTGVCGTWLFYAPEQDLYFAGGVSQITSPAVPFRFVPNQLRLLAK